jgi:hypothetical protein
MKASSTVTRWLNYQANTHELGTDKTDKRVSEVGSVSFVSPAFVHESPVTRLGIRARVRGQVRFKLTAEAEPCWHCKGRLTCDCALCGAGVPGRWQAGICGACHGAGFLTWVKGWGGKVCRTDPDDRARIHSARN